MGIPTTVKQYLAALPADRRAALEAIIEAVELSTVVTRQSERVLTRPIRKTSAIVLGA